MLRRAESFIGRLVLLALVVHPLAAGRMSARAQASQAQAGDAYAERLRVFEEFVAEGMKRDRIPGMTIGFSKDDYTWVKGFGFADLENRVPAAAESVYRLASITKSFTGEAV